MSDADFIKSFYKKEDIGLQPTSREWTDEERKIVSLSMAVQAAMTQMSLEGKFDPREEQHFLIHLQDFAARLYAGEDLNFGSGGATFRVNSKAGDLFYITTNGAIKEGKLPIPHDKAPGSPTNTHNTNQEEQNTDVKHTLH